MSIRITSQGLRFANETISAGSDLEEDDLTLLDFLKDEGVHESMEDLLQTIHYWHGEDFMTPSQFRSSIRRLFEAGLIEVS